MDGFVSPLDGPESWRYARKLYLPNTTYHLTTRRVDRPPLFRDAEDFAVFEDLLARLLAPRSARDRWGNTVTTMADRVQLLAYCQMPTHPHLVIHQRDDPRAIATFMRRAKQSYSRYYRRRYGFTGDLYEDRYRAVTIETPTQLANAIAYVHANPIERAFDHRWSSHRLYMADREARRAHWCDAEAGLRCFTSRAHYLDRLHIAVANKRRDRDTRSNRP